MGYLDGIFETLGVLNARINIDSKGMNSYDSGIHIVRGQAARENNW